MAEHVTARASIVAALALGLSAGCTGTPEPCTFASVDQPVSLDWPRHLDVLFVLDDSGSMRGHAARLARELPSLVEVLVRRDVDRDGEPDLADLGHLHVGVVRTDMGSWGVPTPTCADAERGGDGRLVRGACAPSAPAFLQFAPRDSWSDAAAESIACRFSVGTEGCGFEQPLEAALKALSPSEPTESTPPDYEPPRFFVGTGHGDGDHAGFSRPRAFLAIVPVTDEDDCSVADPVMFDVDARAGDSGDADPGCFGDGAEGAMHPVERYVDGLLALRRYPPQVIFSPIVGVPADLQGVDPDTGEPQRLEWDRLVGAVGSERDPRMTPTLRDGALEPSCTSPEGATATPPVRITRLARALEGRGASVSLSSICENDWSPALLPIVRAVGGHFGSTCAPAGTDVRPCLIRVILPEGIGCDSVPGASTPSVVPFERDGRAICELTQLVPTAEERAAGLPPVGDGWYVDDYTTHAEHVCGRGGEPYQRLAATVQVPSGSDVRLACHRIVTDPAPETCP